MTPQIIAAIASGLIIAFMLVCLRKAGREDAEAMRAAAEAVERGDGL